MAYTGLHKELQKVGDDVRRIRAHPFGTVLDKISRLRSDELCSTRPARSSSSSSRRFVKET